MRARGLRCTVVVLCVYVSVTTLAATYLVFFVENKVPFKRFGNINFADHAPGLLHFLRGSRWIKETMHDHALHFKKTSV